MTRKEGDWGEGVGVCNSERSPHPPINFVHVFQQNYYNLFFIILGLG